MTPAALHEELETNGFAVSSGLLDTEEVDALTDCLDRLHEHRIPTTAQVLYTHTQPAEPRLSYDRLMMQWFNPHRRSLVGSTAEVIARVARRLAQLELDLVPFQDAFLVKTGAHAPFPWHQDEPFWPFEAPTGLVAWCALDPVDRANGGLELARGSHRYGRGPAIDLHTGAPQGGATGALPDLSAFESVCPALSPGDAVLFRPRTWHRSERNASGARRRGWSSSWLPPGTRMRAELAPRHPLARGGQEGAAP